RRSFERTRLQARTSTSPGGRGQRDGEALIALQPGLSRRRQKGDDNCRAESASENILMKEFSRRPPQSEERYSNVAYCRGGFMIYDRRGFLKTTLASPVALGMERQLTAQGGSLFRGFE